MNIGTQLRLRPFVSSDGMIRMEVHPERSTGALDVNGIPQTNTSEVTTNIMVRDGTTIVIGGLMDTEIEQQVQGIPFLMDLPLLGSLFRHTTNTTTKRELVVILTPYICRPECPEATNYLGRPRALGLDERVSKGRWPKRRTVPASTKSPRLGQTVRNRRPATLPKQRGLAAAALACRRRARPALAPGKKPI